MKTSRLYSALPLCCAVVLAIAASACNTPGADASAPHVPATTTSATTTPTSASTPSLAQRITVEIDDAACDSPAQCRTLPYGHKACGGPERYLAYSTRKSDPVRLTQLGADLANARRAEEQKTGMMSTCSVVPDPGATCSAGHCVLQQAGPGGAVAR
jgi:hypothetical protein